MTAGVIGGLYSFILFVVIIVVAKNLFFSDSKLLRKQTKQYLEKYFKNKKSRR